jgi:crossover junction endonuclease EME1
MASSQIPVVDILDDDDDDLAAFASPPSSRKRSHGSAASTSPEDFRKAFSPSPPLKKQLTRAAGDPIVLDDTPSPPKRRPSSSAPKLPVLVVDDDDDPLAPDDVVRETPDSVLHCAGFSETPEMAVSSSSSLGTFVAETPGFTSPRSVGPNAALGLSSATPAHNFSGIVSSPVAAFSFCQQ